MTKKSYPGKFITFEGIEGVGKSTQCLRLRKFLNDKGIDVILTREPGGTPLAESIRSVVLDRDDEAISSEAELLLMFAARAVHLSNKIIPALENGTWVICDRFTDATFAYQGYGRGQSLAFIQQLANQVQQGTFPDLTILLDAPIDTGLERVAQRVAQKGDSNRFDAEKREFFAKVQNGYYLLAEENINRIKKVNAVQGIDDVADEIGQLITEYLC